MVVKHLLTVPEVTDLVNNRISPRLPQVPTWPLVRIQRIGGIPLAPYRDAARLQVECWGNSEPEATQVAREVYRALHQMPGVHPDGVVNTVKDEAGFAAIPDQPTGRPRVIFDVRVVART